MTNTQGDCHAHRLPVGSVEVRVQRIFPALFLEYRCEGKVFVQPITAQDLLREG